MRSLASVELGAQADPCSRLGRGSTKLSRLQRSSWADGATRDDKGRLPDGENRGRDTEPPTHARGKSGATSGAAFTTSPCNFPFHQPSRPCRASEADQLHRAGVHQEPAALLHQRCQTSVTSNRSVEGEQAHCQPARAVQAKTGGVAADHGWRARWRGPIRLPPK